MWSRAYPASCWMYTGIKRPGREAGPFVHLLLLMSPWCAQGQLPVGRFEGVCHGVMYAPRDVSNQYSYRETACTDAVLVLPSRIVTQCRAVRVARTGSAQFSVTIAGPVPHIRPRQPLPHPFQFTLLWSSYCLASWTVGALLNNKTHICDMVLRLRIVHWSCATGMLESRYVQHVACSHSYSFVPFRLSKHLAERWRRSWQGLSSC